MRTVRTVLLCALMGLFLAGTGATAGGDPLPVIRVGILTSTTDAPLWIADRYGYFKDEGLSVQFLTFSSGEQMIAPLSTGQLDVGGGSGCRFGLAKNRKKSQCALEAGAIWRTSYHELCVCSALFTV